LKAGRCTHVEPEGLGDEEKEEVMAKLAEEDKTEERFKAINENTKIEKLDAWTSKIGGDLQSYNRAGGEGTLSYSINIIRSNRWPGAITIQKGGKFCNLYVGDGIKRG
jgi:predicted ThiF/HesA family dinucleotide-utilizing enzyme